MSNEVYLIIILIGIVIAIGMWCKLMDAKEELKYLENQKRESDAKGGKDE